MAHLHADAEGFGFHDVNLATACRAEASSEGGMNANFFPARAKAAKLAKESPPGLRSLRVLRATTFFAVARLRKKSWRQGLGKAVGSQLPQMRGAQ
jgi:hypothetical protein